jgi:glycosyltransferase involved in cell wall biosynthesis
LPEVLAACPDAQVLLIGDDGPPAYGVAAGPGRTWKRRMLDELGARLDLDRVHFMGAVPHELMVGAFSITRAHVYLTYPFVLSWSLIEAMGCEALVVASDTGPVRDVVSHGENGLLQPFLDVAGLSRTLMEVLREPERFAPLKAAARASVLARFDRSRVGVPGWLQLIDEVHPDQA